MCVTSIFVERSRFAVCIRGGSQERDGHQAAGSALSKLRGTWLYVLCIEYVGLTEAGASLAGHQVECRWYNGDDMVEVVFEVPREVERHELNQLRRKVKKLEVGSQSPGCGVGAGATGPEAAAQPAAPAASLSEAERANSFLATGCAESWEEQASEICRLAHQEDLNGIIRKWQGEIPGFHCAGSYEDIARKGVNFLASVNGRTARLSAKDLQKGLKEVLGEADPAPSAWAKMTLETLSWRNKRIGNKLRGSPGAASAASGGAAPSAADQGSAILALHGARAPPRERMGDEGARVAPSQGTVASSPPSTRKAQKGASYQAEKTATFKEDEDWVDYNTMELARARHCPEAWLGLKEERFRLRQGAKGFAVITVGGEAVETLVANAALQAAEQGGRGKAVKPQQAHPKGGAKKRPAAAPKRPAAANEEEDEEEDEDEAKGARARDDSEDGELESSQETNESDLEGAAGGSSKRRPAAAVRKPAAAEEKHAAADRSPSLEVHKPRSQVRQWTAGDYSEAQMREMAADMVSKLCTREITEATVKARGEELLRDKFGVAEAVAMLRLQPTRRPRGGGGGGPPGKDPFKDTLRDGLPGGGEEAEEEEEEDDDDGCMVVYEGEPEEELMWLPEEMGKRAARGWVKARGGQRCTRCQQDKFVHACLSHSCQKRNQATRNQHMAIVVRPKARNRMSKGARQREFLGFMAKKRALEASLAADMQEADDALRRTRQKRAG
ncbi:unnamed protein product [Prorocentrum cordatum]|uniref:Uncharacterized protein n=1 Tax=Prorocentrum cordatum TaxID=2364126 RepID=A0ABN9R8V2_9DINO|nr:unnamed protein product [Polarella glacialis]